MSKSGRSNNSTSLTAGQSCQLSETSQLFFSLSPTCLPLAQCFLQPVWPHVGVCLVAALGGRRRGGRRRRRSRVRLVLVVLAVLGRGGGGGGGGGGRGGGGRGGHDDDGDDDQRVLDCWCPFTPLLYLDPCPAASTSSFS